MFCTSCGYSLTGMERYCPQCGKPAADQTPRRAFSDSTGRRLVRPMREKSIAGVCAGFARYLDVDVTLMRIIWLCAGIFTGVGFIAYLVCWIVMPKDWSPEAPEAQAAGHPVQSEQASSTSV